MFHIVLPALENVHNTISTTGLGSQIKDATGMGVLGTDFPPTDGALRPELGDYLNRNIGFIVNNGIPLLVNIYPYLLYINNKAQINLKYVLFTSADGVVVSGVWYQNLFYAILDAVYVALEESGGSSMEIVVSESGCLLLEETRHRLIMLERTTRI
ncbi:Glucan endo-1,3-beta-glucosidase [Sesamum alatum]|uniref:Glucan endo-1,3-beta-glucosidase n=1 Tax=Sesamum alatum TaxID=300844 RepID=A0AAE1YFB6_9LAMI|nr:Glucan endo-1,3-beta-glucosidase [Sesamum alatum]